MRLASFDESSGLQEDESQGQPIVFLPRIGSAPLGVEVVFAGLDHPVPELDVLLVSDDDVGAAERPMDDLLPVQKGEALDDGQEGVYDFLLREGENAEGAPAILDLGPQRRLLLGVEEAIAIANRSDEGGVAERALLVD